MQRAYFASHISDNILVTPPIEREDGTKVPGRLICKDAVIARTGWQTYSVGDLDPKEAEALGVDITNPTASIDLYRSEEEVFAPATIASFNTAPVTLEHPNEFVASDNWRDVSYGHVQDVRRGSEALESGELPLIADVIINAEPLFSQVLSGALRQISCGYQYRLKRDGDKLLQTAILGNHVALVPKGRAGPEARIYDAAPALGAADLWEGHAAAPLIETASTESAAVAPPQPKSVEPEHRQSNQKENNPVTNWFQRVAGLGLKSLIADPDTKPEQYVEAAVAIGKMRAQDSDEESEEKRKKEAKEAEDAKRAKDESEEKEKKKAEDAKRAKDEVEEKEKKESETKAAEDAQRAKDAELSHFAPCKVKDCGDRGCRMHHALDDALKSHPEEDDADMKELQELLSGFQGSPSGDSAQVIEPISEDEMDHAHDAATRGANDALEALRKERKGIVDSGDKAKIADFNRRLLKLTGSSQATSASHAAFAQGARARDRQATSLSDKNQQLTAHFKKLRGNISQEAK